MPDFVFNTTKGRGVELYNRVVSDDPANSALIIVPLSASGTEAQGQDLDTLQAVLADANFEEQTAGGWSRKVLTQADLAAPAPDDVNNRYAVALPVVTWPGPTAPNNVTGFLVCYDPDTTAGTDANILPITHHQRAVTADGNEVQINAGDFLRAS